MNVGIMAGVYYPETGGSATYLRRLRSDLLERGHSVRIVCYGEQPSEDGVWRVSRKLPVLLRVAVFAWLVATRLRRSDVWFVNDYGLVAAALSAIFRIPTLMKVVGDWAWESGMNQGRVLLHPQAAGGLDPLVSFQHEPQHPLVGFRRFVRTQTAHAMNAILVPSQYLATVVSGWDVPEGRIFVVPNAMTLPDLSPVASRSRGLVVTAARLVPWKGIDHLIRAISAARLGVPEVRLRVLGDGPERERLESLTDDLHLRDIVEFRGHVDRSEVQESLGQAEVFALPSGYEGLPHVILEAMAAGCAVVGGRAGGTPEAIRDGVDGILVSYGDERELSKVLAELLSDRELRERLGYNARTSVQATFRWDRTSAGAIRILEELGAGRYPQHTET